MSQNVTEKNNESTSNWCNDSEDTLSASSDIDLPGEVETVNNSDIYNPEVICRYNCSKCTSKFSDIYHYRSHLRKMHAVPENELPKLYRKSKENNKFHCVLCNVSFKEKKYLRRHEKLKHPMNYEDFSHPIHKCPICRISISKNDVKSHIKEQHDLIIKDEQMQFPSEEMFNEWKLEIENSSKSKFITSRTIHKGKKCYYYYTCHRSGNFVSESKGKRRLKSKGSNKINCFCPAFINMVKNLEGQCSVTFSLAHFGHHNEVERLPLTTAEREFVATKVVAKVPFDKILNEVRSSTDEGLERLRLLTRQDLHNIASSCNLHSQGITRNDIVDTSYQETVTIVADLVDLSDQETETIVQPSQNIQNLLMPVDAARKKLLLQQYTELIESTNCDAEFDVLEKTLRSLKLALLFCNINIS